MKKTIDIYGSNSYIAPMNNNTLLKKIELGEDKKEYITAPSRIAEFRRLNPNHTLISTYEMVDGDTVIVQSTVLSGNKPISTGLSARKIYSVEDYAIAETLSKARAVAFFGVGLSDADIASAEEIISMDVSKKLASPAPTREGKVIEKLQEKLAENDGRRSKK